jgi:hypothetical protein
MVAGNRSAQEGLARIVGNDAAQSDYALERATLEVTPDQFSPLMSKSRAVQQWMLFTMKEELIPRGRFSEIYFVNTKEFRGFQYGQPSERSPKYVDVELFADDAQIRIMFGQKPSGPETIAQADINRVVQSLHKVTIPEAKSLWLSSQQAESSR